MLIAEAGCRTPIVHEHGAASTRAPETMGTIATTGMSNLHSLLRLTRSHFDCDDLSHDHVSDSQEHGRCQSGDRSTAKQTSETYTPD